MPEITLHHGDCLEVMRTLADASVDAVVTDPPYELNFMGREWDRRGITYRVDLWAEALRLLRPGGHLLAFGGTRTYHRLAVAIEDAGFAIEDSIHWLYGQGFPKHKSKLKPAHESIVLATKPGGAKWLGVDACRVALCGERPPTGSGDRRNCNVYAQDEWTKTEMANGGNRTSEFGRWPTNLVLTHHPDCNGVCVPGCPVAELDAQSGERELGKFPNAHKRGLGYHGAVSEAKGSGSTPIGDSGGASRFFPTFAWSDDDQDDLRAFYYCGKATRRDRDPGNTHPTIKPTPLMRWLCRLVTPPGGTILDPFLGSGSTLKAAKLEGFGGLGIEIDPEYLAIADRRIAHAQPALAGLA
jgi:DNA modification methylase